MNRYIYRILGLDLFPGNKSAGFELSVDTKALRQLSHINVSHLQHLALIRQAQERASRAELGGSVMRSAMAIHFYNGTAVPRVFSALSGSIGANPESFPRLASPNYLERIGPDVAYTPHNVDAPVEALLLMLLAQTWGEWATDLLSAHADRLDKLAPSLEPIPSYGDLLTLADFKNDHRLGALLPDDGTGYFATEQGMSREDCFGEAPGWATHVVWFNR